MPSRRPPRRPVAPQSPPPIPSRLRSFLAVMLGFMLYFVVIILLNGVALYVVRARHLPMGSSTGYLLFNLLELLVAAVLGGLFTGVLAPGRPVRHGYVRGAVMLVLAALSLYRNGAHATAAQPAWYAAFLPVLPPFFAVVGAGLSTLRGDPSRRP